MTPRRGLFWPVLLIAIGLVFLLANFGLIGPVSALALISLWPLLLILAGIDIAVGRRRPLAALAIDVAVIAAGLALVAAQPVYPRWLVSGGTSGPGQSQVTVPRGAAQSLTLHLSGGAGSFTVSGGASDLVEVASDQPQLAARTAGVDRVDVRIDQSDHGGRFGPTIPVHVDAKIANDVATSLDVSAGAGDFVVDLRDTRISDARVNVGVASLRLVLPKGSGDVPITVSAGASSVIIEIPDGVEARVNTGGALLSVRSENARVAGAETAGYANAKDRVTVRLTAGASSVVIR
ncbi:MAG TPA: DUF5668 domain-containing protein [Candidatus Limnocylindria bacterium]|nr:DUF5668 domain-containing protein [Candidatus Limnocylindria bacterium]